MSRPAARDWAEPDLERALPSLALPGTHCPARAEVVIPLAGGGTAGATLRGWLKDTRGRWCALIEWGWGLTVREDWFVWDAAKITVLGEWEPPGEQAKGR